MTTLDFHRRIKKLNDQWWWVSILKNASTTMEHITVEAQPDADAKFLAIIRNPYDRLVSCWENKGEYFNTDTFEDFVTYVCNTQDGIINAHAQSQTSFIGDQYIDKYIQFESLQEGFKEIGITIPFHHNKTSYSELPEWTEALRKRVRHRYQKDFELYEYCKQLSTLPRRG